MQRESRKILVFLQSYGIGTAMAVRIYKEYGEDAIDLIKKNPYRLSTDIWGIGFHTADQIALNLGVARDSPYRAQAAVRHVLSEATGDGHVGFPEELLREHAVEMTQIPPAGIIDAIEQLRITTRSCGQRAGRQRPGARQRTENRRRRTEDRRRRFFSDFWPLSSAL